VVKLKGSVQPPPKPSIAQHSNSLLTHVVLVFIHACRRALGKHEEAISHYIKRVQMGSWNEERFMSALNIADISRVLWERGALISPQVCVWPRLKLVQLLAC